MLTVEIYSFGFIRGGMPENRRGNGGGFVFDCRLLPNPGMQPGYMIYSGLDPIIQRELDVNPLAQRFLTHVFHLVDEAVEAYREKEFTSLQVSFGCTGGQHRSVYCAEKLASHLREARVDVIVTHREKGTYW